MEAEVGKINKRIYVYFEEEKKDAQGFKVNEEKLFLKTWASINSVSGTEIIKSNSDFEKVRKRFLVRYDSKTVRINHDMFIKFNGRRYDVKYTNNYNESNQYIEIITEEIKQ